MLIFLYVLYEKSYYNVKCKNKKIYLMYVRMYNRILDKDIIDQ